MKKVFALLAMIMMTLTGCQNQVQAIGQSLQDSPEKPQEMRKDWRAISTTSGEVCDTLTFNTMVDNALLGDEHRFLRIVEYGENGSFEFKDYSSEDPCVLESEWSYNLLIYCHNTTDPGLGDQALAKDVTIKIISPGMVQAGEVANLKAEISYTTDWVNESYQCCTCELPVTANNNIEVTISSIGNVINSGGVISVGSSEAVAFDPGRGKIWLLEDNLSKYGGLGSPYMKTFWLDKGIGPGYEEVVIIFIQLNIK